MNHVKSDVISFTCQMAYIYLLKYLFVQVVQKIRKTSKHSQWYYTSKRLKGDLLSNNFVSQYSDLRIFLTFTRQGGMR